MDFSSGYAIDLELCPGTAVTSPDEGRIRKIASDQDMKDDICKEFGH